MLTQERATYLWSRRGWQNELPHAFRLRCDDPHKRLDADGLTDAEDKHVRDLWKTMPGHCCWMDAFNRIRRGLT